MLRPIVLSVIFFPLILFGQNSLYHLQFNTSNNSNNEFVYTEKKTNKFHSKEEVKAYLSKIRSKQIKKGFVLSSVDNIEWKNDTAFVDFYLGEKFKEIVITYNEEDQYIIRKSPRLNERLLLDHPFEPPSVEQLLKNITKYLNSVGYPFSKVYLEVDQLSPHHSSAHLIIDKGPLVKVQNIYIKGETKINEKYIQSAISIKKGDLYNTRNFKNISNKVSQIQFVKEIRPHEILFTPEGADLYLYLESAPVSSINGVVGLQPNPVTGKTTVTGDVQLKLLNILKRGEELHLNWRSLQPKTQELKVDFNLPFLFNTPFGVDAKFNLYKLDSTYLRLDFNLGVRYYFSGANYIKAFYHNESTNLLYGAPAISNSNLASLKSHQYGLGFYHFQVDYLPNPSKGLNATMDISIGTRKSTPQDADTTINAISLRGNLQIEAFIPITRRHVVRLANSTQSFFAPKIYQNELFRFGGLNIQRGFNEESLFATTLTTFTVEYRFLVDRTSHAFAFYDQTFYENNSRSYSKDAPLGFGLGYAFGTKLGIFSISYALGKQFNNPIQMRDGKVHFGYTAYF